MEVSYTICGTLFNKLFAELRQISYYFGVLQIGISFPDRQNEFVSIINFVGKHIIGKRIFNQLFGLRDVIALSIRQNKSEQNGARCRARHRLNESSSNVRLSICQTTTRLPLFFFAFPKNRRERADDNRVNQQVSRRSAD